MKIVIEGKQIGQSDSTVYPVHISTKRNAVISEITSSSVAVSVYNNNALVKTISVIKPASGTINLDLCIFAPLLPEVKFNSIFATQDIRIVDGSQSFRVFVLNQRANNYDKKFSTDKKIIPYSNVFEYFGGKGGEVVPVIATVESKANYCSNGIEGLSSDGYGDKGMNLNISDGFICESNKRRAISIMADVNIKMLQWIPGVSISMSILCEDINGNDVICEILEYGDISTRFVKTVQLQYDIRYVKLARVAIANQASGYIRNIVVEAGTASDYTKANLPTSYTVGSGIGLNLDNIGELKIGSESCVYKRGDGLAIRWQGIHGGSESACIESYKMQDQFESIHNTNSITGKLIQLDIPSDNKGAEYYNSICFASLIEVFTGTKWIKATCTNKAGAIYDNSNGINKTVITLKTEAWT